MTVGHQLRGHARAHMCVSAVRICVHGRPRVRFCRGMGGGGGMRSHGPGHSSRILWVCAPASLNLNLGAEGWDGCRREEG